LTEYVATRWYRAPEIMLAFKWVLDYGVILPAVSVLSDDDIQPLQHCK
jgi:hypothetical protein